MSFASADTAPRGFSAGSLGIRHLPGAILFVFALLALGVLDPQLYPLNFNQLTLPGAVRDASTPNIYNQLRWAALSGLASILVFRAPHRLLRLTIELRYLLLLLALCVVSAVWSQHPDATLRRAVALIMSAYCLLVAVTYIERVDRAVQLVYLAFWAALVLNLAVLGRAEAFDEVGFYRGAAGNKNTLGAIAGLAMLVGFAVNTGLGSVWLWLTRLVYLAAWAGLLILSVSKTSMGLVLIVPALFFLLRAASSVLRVSFGAAALGLAAFLLIAFFLGHYGMGYSLADFGRLVLSDVTLSERTPIWNFMLREIGKHWLLGTGFGAFWGIGFEAPNLKSIYDFIRLINHAHNGYLDVLVSLGVVGLGILALVILRFGRAAERLRATQGALFTLVWFVLLFSLLHNMLESSLLVPFSAVWDMTLLAMFLCVRARSDAWER